MGYQSATWYINHFENEKQGSYEHPKETSFRTTNSPYISPFELGMISTSNSSNASGESQYVPIPRENEKADQSRHGVTATPCQASSSTRNFFKFFGSCQICQVPHSFFSEWWTSGGWWKKGPETEQELLAVLHNQFYRFVSSSWMLDCHQWPSLWWTIIIPHEAGSVLEYIVIITHQATRVFSAVHQHTWHFAEPSCQTARRSHPRPHSWTLSPQGGQREGRERNHRKEADFTTFIDHHQMIILWLSWFSKWSWPSWGDFEMLQTGGSVRLHSNRAHPVPPVPF